MPSIINKMRRIIYPFVTKEYQNNTMPYVKSEINVYSVFSF